jgi:hemerythrin-like metal-binding protein
MQKSEKNLMEWKSEYNTGILKIDTQHQRLVELINNLTNAYSSKADRHQIEKIFLGLVNYCNYHFTSEEQVMQDHNYHEYTDHKNKHDNFFDKIDECKMKYHKGNAAALLDTIDYLNEWLIDHILVEDRKYVPELFDKFNR